MFYQFLFLLVVFGALKADGSTCGISPSLNRYRIFNPDRVFGGENSNEGDFPWYIWMYRNGGKGCSGSIISNKWILTAAHCVIEAKNITIYYGSVDWKIMETQKIEALRYVMHPEYSGAPGYTNDVALIELNGTLDFSFLVQPVCLNSTVDPYPNEIMTLIGMGSNYKKRVGSNDTVFPQNILQDAPIQHTANCDAEGWICAGDINHTSLFGDSGGPIMVIREETWIQVGIVSSGRIHNFENEILSVRIEDFYMRISHYCNWIKETTNNEIQC